MTWVSFSSMYAWASSWRGTPRRRSHALGEHHEVSRQALLLRVVVQAQVRRLEHCPVEDLVLDLVLAEPLGGGGGGCEQKGGDEDRDRRPRVEHRDSEARKVTSGCGPGWSAPAQEYRGPETPWRQIVRPPVRPGRKHPGPGRRAAARATPPR